MKVLVLALLLCGCAETRIYESGRLVCVMQGDYTNVTFRTGGGTYFHADTLNHSEATKAVGDNLVKGIGALGSAATGVAAVIK